MQCNLHCKLKRMGCGDDRAAVAERLATLTLTRSGDSTKEMFMLNSFLPLSLSFRFFLNPKYSMGLALIIFISSYPYHCNFPSIWWFEYGTE